MATKYADHAQQVYDQVAGAYDDLWSKNVQEPNARLTTELVLRRGDRLLDLACGTGVFTLPMARVVAPAECVAVDYSEGMLEAGKIYADRHGVPNVSWVQAKAEDYITIARPESFDAVSCRFVLAYVDWKAMLPAIGRIVRRGGRVGILTSTSASIPQAFEVYAEWMQGFGPVELPSPVPADKDVVAEHLAAGGLVPTERWEYTIRLWFDDGMQAARWMRESGYGTHAAFENIDASAMETLMQLFAAGMEQKFREEKGVPLDIVIAGVIATKS